MLIVFSYEREGKLQPEQDRPMGDVQTAALGLSIAYSSDRGGKFDIWVQQVSGGDPVQITKRPGQNLQPDWSPDGKYITYRSEQGEGGIYVIPALGGAGLRETT